MDLNDLNLTVVATAVGSTVATTTATLVALHRFFMPRNECVKTHSDVEVKLKEEDDKRKELRKVLDKVNVRIRRVDKRLDIYSERQRWLIAGVDSLMKKAGANGVPPPPINDADHELDFAEDEEDP